MFDLKHFKEDFFAGLVVFLVSLPLCLGIALASDAPLFSGIIAGILGGILVTTISRSALGVSGPRPQGWQLSSPRPSASSAMRHSCWR